MKTKSLQLNIQLVGSGRSKTAILRGFAYLESGFLQGDITSIDERLTQSELVLVSAFTFTGCPIAARTSVPELNPWVATDGEYSGGRSMKLNGTRADSRLVCQRRGSESICMELRVDVRGEIPELITIERPFQERICQRGKAQFEGSFEIVFADRDGRLLRGHAQSRYDLNVSHDYPPVWRNITIINSQNSERFSQVEQIDMFSDAAVAAKDLEEKCRVFVGPASPRPRSI